MYHHQFSFMMKCGNIYRVWKHFYCFVDIHRLQLFSLTASLWTHPTPGTRGMTPPSPRGTWSLAWPNTRWGKKVISLLMDSAPYMSNLPHMKSTFLIRMRQSWLKDKRLQKLYGKYYPGFLYLGDVDCKKKKYPTANPIDTYIQSPTSLFPNTRDYICQQTPGLCKHKT